MVRRSLPLWSGAIDGEPVLPPPPDELKGMDLRVEYVSILAQAQKMAGLQAADRLVSFAGNLAAIKEEMLRVFNQKRALGLVDCEKDLRGFSDEPPMLLLVLVNHDPDKSRLRELLRTLPPSPHAELRIATGSLLGYGLYDPAILTIYEALARFEACI